MSLQFFRELEFRHPESRNPSPCMFHSVFSYVSSLGFPGLLWRGIELSEREAGPACSSEPLPMAPCSPSSRCLLVCFSSPPLTPPGLLLWFVYLQTALILEGPLWAMAGPFCWPFWPLASLTQRPGLLVGWVVLKYLSISVAKQFLSLVLTKEPRKAEVSTGDNWLSSR